MFLKYIHKDRYSDPQKQRNLARDELLLKNRSMQEINQFEMFSKKSRNPFWAQIDGDSSGGPIFCSEIQIA